MRRRASPHPRQAADAERAAADEDHGEGGRRRPPRPLEAAMGGERMAATNALEPYQIRPKVKRTKTYKEKRSQLNMLSKTGPFEARVFHLLYYCTGSFV